MGSLPVPMFEIGCGAEDSAAGGDTPIHAKYPALDFVPAARAVLGETRQMLQDLGYIGGRAPL